MIRRILGSIAVAALLLPGTALANPYDISIRGLGRPASSTLTDPAVKRFRFMSNELVMALAPRVLAPAETLGLDGFEFALISNITPISYDSGYWKGQPGNPVFEGNVTGTGIPKVIWAPTAHIRKGLPLSQEVGLIGSYMAWSEMFMLGVEYKIAWHESFFRWVPAFATRLAFSRLFGNSDLDIIAGEADAIASLPFGIGGMASFTPYIGYGQLFAHTNSQVIDETPYNVTDPNLDQRGGNDGSLYNFPTLSWNEGGSPNTDANGVVTGFKPNTHGRLFLGARLVFAFVELLFEFNYMFMDGPNDLTSYSVKFGFDV